MPVLQSPNSDHRAEKSPGSEYPENPPVTDDIIAAPPTNFLEKFHRLIVGLPDTIPEASDYNVLAVFSTHPEGFDDPSLDADELWETVLNQLLKSTLGWGTEGDMSKIIRRGKKGLDGLANFVRHYIIKRGVSEGLFEGKLSFLMEELSKRQ